MIHPTLDPDETGASSTTTEEEIVQSPLTGKKVRKAFFMKVYLVLTGQFLFHLGVVITFVSIPELRELFYDYFWLMYVYLGVFIILMVALAAFEKLRTLFPLNVLFLLLITFLIGLCFGMLTAHFEVYGIVYGVAATAAITFIMTIFAVFSPFDILSKNMVFLLIFLMITILGSGISLVAYLFEIDFLHLVLSTVFVVVASIYIFLLTELMIAGRLARLESDQCVAAVIYIYCSFVYLFFTVIEVCIGFCK